MWTSAGSDAGLHLPHHLAAMRLDGDLADAELAADLLVQEAGHDQDHHLALAWRQRPVALVQLHQPGLALQDVPAAFERTLDGVDQRLVTPRGGEELHGAGLHRLDDDRERPRTP